MKNSTKKFNILFIAPRVPYPLDTGAKIRTYNLLKYIGERHRVTFICFSWDAHDKEYLSEIEKLVSRVIFIPVRKYSKINLVRDALLSIAGNLPMIIRKYINRDMSRAIAEMVSSERFDIVHCDHLHTAYYGMNIPNVVRVLDEHNIEHIIWQRYYETEQQLLKRSFLNIQREKIRDYEKSVIRKFDRCCVVSEGDNNNLKVLNPEVQSAVISNGVDVQYFKPQEQKGDPRDIVFTGSMNWLPNEDAMIYFIKEILPLIRIKVPDVRLTIVGQSPSATLIKHVRNLPNIEITGRVDDVRPYIARAGIYIVPIRIGGGTRLKILEAMAMGKPVISTTIGYEGIKAIPEEDIAAADAPDKFAECVIELMSGKSRRDSLSVRGRQLVEKKYSWEIIGSLLEEVYISLCRK